MPPPQFFRLLVAEANLRASEAERREAEARLALCLERANRPKQEQDELYSRTFVCAGPPPCHLMGYVSWKQDKPDDFRLRLLQRDSYGDGNCPPVTVFVRGNAQQVFGRLNQGDLVENTDAVELPGQGYRAFPQNIRKLEWKNERTPERAGVEPRIPKE
ncbi:hypothetical protein FOZ63_029831, partial [Perkinsus olseni]